MLQPIRVHRDRFLRREEEFRKQLLLAAAKCGEQGWILVVLDADDDCPATLAADVYQRAKQHVPHRRLSVVLAKREYEAWFIAAARSLDGRRGFRCPDEAPVDAETRETRKAGYAGTWKAEPTAKCWISLLLRRTSICNRRLTTVVHSASCARNGKSTSLMWTEIEAWNSASPTLSPPVWPA